MDGKGCFVLQMVIVVCLGVIGLGSYGRLRRLRGPAAYSGYMYLRAVKEGVGDEEDEEA